MSVPRLESSIECYLWDLVDEGIEDALDRIKGEIGATRIVVPVAAPAIRQLRPHAGVSPRTFCSQGGAQFQPDTTCYGGTRLRPHVAEWLRKSNPLRHVADAARQRGFGLEAWVVACESHALIQRHDHAGIKDVLGDRHDEGVCPVNPDVQEYVRAVIQDVTTQCGFDTVRLSAAGFPWLFDEHDSVHGGELRGLPVGPVENWLRHLCFCESCRQLAGRAGVDMEAAAQTTRDALERWFDTGETIGLSLAEFVEDRADLGALVGWRIDQMTAWMMSIRKACTLPLMLAPPQDALRSGVDVKAIGSAYDQLVVFSHSLEPQRIDATLQRAVDLCGSIDRVTLRLSAAGSCPDANALVKACSHAALSGIRHISLHNYGLLPAARFDWLRQAIRFAQREVSL